MKVLGCLVGGILSVAIALHLIGLTSAMQIQKTVVFAVLLCLILCPMFAWVFGKLRRSSN